MEPLRNLPEGHIHWLGQQSEGPQLSLGPLAFLYSLNCQDSSSW